jgi:hypothetical protein
MQTQNLSTEVSKGSKGKEVTLRIDGLSFTQKATKDTKTEWLNRRKGRQQR